MAPSPVRPSVGRLLEAARRPRDERGAVVVEMALISLFLFTIIAGIADTSMYLRSTYEVSSAARAGVRIAASDPLNANMALNAATQASNAMASIDRSRVVEIWVYEANRVGVTPATAPPATCASQCVKFTLNANGSIASQTGTWTARNVCAGATDTVDSAGVLVRYRHKSPVMFFQNTVITEFVVMRLEQVPSSQTCVSSP